MEQLQDPATSEAKKKNKRVKLLFFLLAPGLCTHRNTLYSIFTNGIWKWHTHIYNSTSDSCIFKQSFIKSCNHTAFICEFSGALMTQITLAQRCPFIPSLVFKAGIIFLCCYSSFPGGHFSCYDNTTPLWKTLFSKNSCDSILKSR